MRTSPEARGGRSEVRRRALAVALCCLGTIALGACRQDMHNQPKIKPLRENAFFADGSGSRPLVEDTVARGQLNDDPLLYTGKENGQLAAEFPFPVTREVVDRGQERFNIYCAPCHDRAGTGRGIIVRRGYRQPPSFHDQRLKDVPVGHFFDVMTNGFGAMPDYRAQVRPEDRWAIAAYIRALQQMDAIQTAPATATGQERH